ncbi:hypothetical protein CaCOL14_004964 [Colletotrichum acutatum]
MVQERQTFHSHCHAWCWSGSQKEYAKQAGDTVCIDGGDVFNVWYAAQVQRIHGTWKHGPGPESGPSRLSQQRVKVVGALFSGVPIPTIPAGPVHLAYLSRCKAPGGQDTLPGVPGSSPLPDVHSTWPLIGHVKVLIFIFISPPLYFYFSTRPPLPRIRQPPNSFPHLPFTTAKLDSSVVMSNAPPPALLPPPEGIFRTFEDLLTSVQRVAKDQGYGVVKLRASNYRDGKPTRYDLVCDRGGVKYSSTAKKRNPSTRKVDCPWRAKAVCEVQLGNQWRFAVQEGSHNHEPRIATAPPGQENTPLAQSIRSFTNKIDRLNHDMNQGFGRIEQALDTMNKRLENLENRAGGYEPRFQNMESRLQGMEARGSMELPMDDVDARLLSSSVM